MDRKIIFDGRDGYFDVPVFTLSDNEDLRIQIGLPRSKIGRYYFAARHGNESMRVLLTSDSSVELSADWLKKGGIAPIICEIELRDRTGVVVYEKYNVEPLEIAESDVGVEYFSAVQAIQKANVELYKTLNEVKAELAAVKKIVGAIPTAIEEAKKEAVIEAAGGDPMGA